MKKGTNRRRLFLETAEKLFYARGYEQTSVQDILDELNFSKGGFYHHFESKFALLEAICEKRAQQCFEATKNAIDDCHGSPLDKLNALFENSAIWHSDSDSVDYISLLIRVAYRDDGALMREKMKQHQLELILPILNRVVDDGVHEGLFFVPRGGGIGELVFRLSAQLTDEIAFTLASLESEQEALSTIIDKLELYRYAIERLLGAPFGSIVLFNAQDMATICREMMQQGVRK